MQRHAPLAALAILGLVAVFATVLAGLSTGHAQDVAGIVCPNAVPFELGYEDALPGPLAIPDNAPAGVQDCMWIPTAEAQAIGDLQVAMTINHTWVGDLVVKLTHVDTGTTVVLLDRPGLPSVSFGCANDNVRVTFSDAAALPAENECSVTPPAIYGTLLPAQVLSAFDGELIGGSWVLNVSDNSPQDTGSLVSWTLLPTYLPPLPPPPPPPTDTPTPANTPAPTNTDTPTPANTPAPSNTPAPTSTPASPNTPTPMPTNPPTATSTPTAANGNVNCDSTVNAIDAALVLQYSAGLVSALPCQQSADVNHNGVVDAIDAALVLQFSAGLLPGL